jgi:hypothetical protein
MTANNINIEEFIKILMSIKNSGIKLINLDMLPDESHPTMNKLVIHPVKIGGFSSSKKDENIGEPIIRNPEIRTDNDDIFNLFDDII